MADHAGAQVFNLGNGDDFSVVDVLTTARAVIGRDIPFVIAPRRPGDPPTLVASSARARSELGWQPQYTAIDGIIESAWRWHCGKRH